MPTLQDRCTELNERTDGNISDAPVSTLAVALAAQRVGVRLRRVPSQLRCSPGPLTLRTSFNITLSEVTYRLRAGVASFLNSRSTFCFLTNGVSGFYS